MVNDRVTKKTVGLDLSDKDSTFVVLDEAGQVAEVRAGHRQAATMILRAEMRGEEAPKGGKRLSFLALPRTSLKAWRWEMLRRVECGPA